MNDLNQEPTSEVTEKKWDTKQPLEAKDILNNSVVAVREIETGSIGLKEIDILYKKGIPKISNILLVGPLNANKQVTCINLVINRAVRGQRAAYLSFNLSEEKILNLMKQVDKDILNYLNEGNILVKKVDPFEIERFYAKPHKEKDRVAKFLEKFQFIQDFNPSLIIVDSITALKQVLQDDNLHYRQYLDTMFKFFAILGVTGVFIKDLPQNEKINKEFYEYILADSILYFSKSFFGKTKIKLVKSFELKPSESGFWDKIKGLFS